MLALRYKGKSIHEVLNLTVAEAQEFFDSPEIVRRLRILCERTPEEIMRCAASHTGRHLKGWRSGAGERQA